MNPDMKSDDQSTSHQSANQPIPINHIDQSTNQPNQSTNRFVDESTNQSTSRPVDQSTIRPFDQSVLRTIGEVDFGFLGELSMVSSVALWAQGDTHWVQVFCLCCFSIYVESNGFFYHSAESSCVRVHYIRCAVLPLSCDQEQNRESPKHEVRELRRHGQSSFTRLGNHFQERQVRREPWNWPLQGFSVRVLNFCRHRN